MCVVPCKPQVIEMALSKYERWLKSEGDTFQSTLYEKIVRELMTLGESLHFVNICATYVAR